MSEIFRTTRDLSHATLLEMARDLPGVAVAGVAMMALSIGPEMYLSEDRVIVLIGSITGFAAQYWLTRRSIDRHGLLRRGGVVANYFGMSFASGLAILVGFVLGVVPALWLAARWIAAGPALFAEDVGAIDSLGRSVGLTTGRVLPIMIVIAVASIPSLMVLSLSFVYEFQDVTASITENVAITVSQLLCWYAAVAVYRSGQGATANP